LPEPNFITIHYLYFIGVCLIISLIFYGSSDPGLSISYTDSLFLVVSAMTEAGLNTVNLSTMTTFQQIILWLLIIFGSSIWVSSFTVLTRKRVFESRFEDTVRRQKEQRGVHRRSMSELRRSMSMSEARDVAARLDGPRKVEGPRSEGVFEGRHSEPRDSTNGITREGLVAVASSKQPADPSTVGGVTDDSEASTANEPTKPGVDEPARTTDPDHFSFMRYASPSREGPSRTRILSFAGVGGHPLSTSFKVPPSEGLTRRMPKKSEQTHDHDERLPHWQYPHYLIRHTTGRNVQFYGLSRPERKHLGGVEDHAIHLLS
jgi:hypothetical protein